MQSNNKTCLLLALEKGYGEGAEVSCGKLMAGYDLGINQARECMWFLTMWRRRYS